jgi:hypothetical protein
LWFAFICRKGKKYVAITAGIVKRSSSCQNFDGGPRGDGGST